MPVPVKREFAHVIAVYEMSSRLQRGENQLEGFRILGDSRSRRYAVTD